jgi:Glycoside hydrolase 123, catalytic domain/Glycoside hydrolase 123 N-terminal domain
MSRWPFLTFAALPLLVSLLRPAPESGLLLWTTHALEKVHPSDPVPQNASQAVKISAARNEFEPFQIVLRAQGQDIDAVDVEVTDLRGAGGLIPSKKWITVYREAYLNLTHPSSVAGGTGEWPDPLIPRVDQYQNEKRNAFPVKLINGRNQPVWIDVYVPPSTPAGAYHGEVRISVAAKPLTTIPVDLEVWNFQLPSTSSMVTTFGFSGNSAIRTHFGRYTNDQDLYHLTTLYQKSALWHRITLDGSAGVAPLLSVVNGHVQVRWDAYDSVIGPFMDGSVFSSGQALPGAKATSVALHTPQVLQTPEQQIQFWRQTAEHFRRKGWFDRFFHYLWDEPKPTEYPKMEELGRAVRRADPEVKNLVTAQLHPEWSDFIDIWAPIINCCERKPHESDYCKPMVERSAYDSETSHGKQLWWYQSCGSHGCFVVGGDYFRGWPSYMIDDAPVRNRIMQWLAWKYGIHGELYFSMNEAYARIPDPWKDVYLFGGNGDGTLFYPGKPAVIGGTTQIPIESIRLKLIREGLEDYEYLLLLTKLEGPSAVANSMNTFIRNTYNYDQEPQKLYDAREWMGREISKMSSAK